MQASNEESERVVRVALVLYGGVSLAIYENGVARCFHELVLRRGVFGLVLRLLRASANVDVIAGTSAGGINGLILAACLESGTEFADTAELWRRLGDFGALLRDVSQADRAESLLDGEVYYHETMLRAFKDLCRPVEGWQSPGEIDLFITGTDLDGHARRYRDSLGTEISDKDHRLIFRFKHRPNRAWLGIEGNKSTPEAVERQAAVLTAVARITSSFPIAFPPFRVTQVKDRADEVAQALEMLSTVGGMQGRSMVDGGVLDNKPFGPVLQAIFYRMPSVPVVRRLFYVEPDPEPFKDKRELSKDASPPAPPSPIAVAAASLSTIPAHEGIAADLEILIEHNQRIRWLGEMQRHFTQRVPVPADSSVGEPDLYLRTRIECLARLLVLKTDAAPSASDYPKEESSKLLLDAFRNALTPQPNSALKAAVEALRSILATVDKFDVSFQQRLAFHLLYALYDAVDRTDTEPLRRAMQQCGRVIRVLEIVFAGMITLRDRIVRQAEAKPTADTVWKVVDAFSRFLAADATHWRQLAEDLQSPALSDLAHRPGEDPPPGAKLLTPKSLTAALKAAGTAAQLIDLEHMAAEPDVERQTILDCAFMALRELGKSCGESAFGIERWVGLDRAIYPLEFTSGIHERDEIRFVRISPEDAQIGLSDRPAREKVAGDELAHFSSFLRRDWRANDLLYGRIDGICQIVRSLLDDQELARAVRRARAQANGRLPYTIEELKELVPQCERGELEAIDRSWAALVEVTDALERSPAPEPQADGHPHATYDDQRWRAAAEAFRKALIEAGQQDVLRSDLEGVLTDHYFQEIAYGRQKGLVTSTESSKTAIEGDAKELARRDLQTLESERSGEQRKKLESMALGTQPIAGANGGVPNDVIGEYVTAAYLLFWGLLERSVGNHGSLLGLGRVRLIFRTPVLFFHHLFSSLRRDRKTALVSALLGVGVVIGFAWAAWMKGDWGLVVAAVAVGLVWFALFAPEAPRWPRVATFVVLLLVGVAAGVGFKAAACLDPPGDGPCAGFGANDLAAPMLALEFATSPGDVIDIVGPLKSPKRAAAAQLLYADFSFIAAYSLLFVTLAVMLFRCVGLPRRVMIGASIAFVGAAAAFDVWENLLLFPALVGVGPANIAVAAQLKWGSFFVALALLSTGFLWRGWPYLALALLAWVAAVLGLAGLAWYSPAVHWAFEIAGVVGIIVAAVLLIAPPVSPVAQRP